MIKGVFIAFAVIIVLMLIPVVHAFTIPFGPFIGGYFGISSVGYQPGRSGHNALVFGLLFGGLILVALAVIVVLVNQIFEFNHILLWPGVSVFTFYYGSMAGLGAWYAGLKAGG